MRKAKPKRYLNIDDDPTINPLTGMPVGVRPEGPHELIARLGLQFVRTAI